MKDYIGEIIGAGAVILAAIIGAFVKNKSRNRQTVKNVDRSNVYQANGSININTKDNKK